MKKIKGGFEKVPLAEVKKKLAAAPEPTTVIKVTKKEEPYTLANYDDLPKPRRQSIRASS